MEDILAFHVLTGCDTTSYLLGHGKKTCWKVFKGHHHLLTGMGQGELDEQTVKDTKLFMCKVYSAPNITRGVSFINVFVLQLLVETENYKPLNGFC